jgi:hypothetical protein
MELTTYLSGYQKEVRLQSSFSICWQLIGQVGFGVSDIKMEGGMIRSFLPSKTEVESPGKFHGRQTILFYKNEEITGCK